MIQVAIINMTRMEALMPACYRNFEEGKALTNFIKG